MNQHEFDILLQKYLSGACDPDEEKKILEWTDLTLSNKNMPLGESELKMTETKIWKRIKASVLSAPSGFGKVGWQWLAVAATVIIISSLAIFYPGHLRQLNSGFIAKDISDDPGLTLVKDYVEIQNVSDHSKIVSLEDGSFVTLTGDSRLKYPKHFDKKVRQVELEGEAFFNIQKDSSRPFFVYTGELVTQVLGTSFNVKSYKDSKTIEVNVVTGRVSVYENTQKAPHNRNGVILRPNQKITFDKESKKLVPGLVEEPVMQNTQDKKLELIFEDAPLSEVLSVIQKAYGVEIVVEKPSLNDCIFLGDLTGLPLHTQLRLICKSVNASYELRGTVFFINGDGCTK
ncbi:hypothetical protein DYBT9275_02437 [Dyadobacter sp. CECT 9275]|uniref:FecR family protein n=1 Tax=Dyadobacter helix TaxID=2822344 RepID=A0A916JBL3_9BACT|nr:FecR family protein [Dyadobacter sp. CECT 9275]CAG5000309.1 hypothetical protein DYBT9275_02437 [Dyadobacter sp. CECT 9275]